MSSCVPSPMEIITGVLGDTAFDGRTRDSTEAASLDKSLNAWVSGSTESCRDYEGNS